MKKLIGIAGKAGAGKDSVANFLWERHGYTKIAFADPLRAMAVEMFGVDPDMFHDRDLKERPLEYWGKAPRELLQLLGNDAVKPIFGEDVWGRRWLLSYHMVANTDNVVVPDVRFDLEAKLIHDLGGIVIELHRDGAGAKSGQGHSSENGLSADLIDFYIENNATLEELFSKIEGVVA